MNLAYVLFIVIVAGTEKKPDVDASKNMAKRTFCRKYDGYEDFCSGRSASNT